MSQSPYASPKSQPLTRVSPRSHAPAANAPRTARIKAGQVYVVDVPYSRNLPGARELVLLHRRTRVQSFLAMLLLCEVVFIGIEFICAGWTDCRALGVLCGGVPAVPHTVPWDVAHAAAGAGYGSAGGSGSAGDGSASGGSAGTLGHDAVARHRRGGALGGCAGDCGSCQTTEINKRGGDTGACPPDDCTVMVIAELSDMLHNIEVIARTGSVSILIFFLIVGLLLLYAFGGPTNYIDQEGYMGLTFVIAAIVMENFVEVGDNKSVLGICLVALRVLRVIHGVQHITHVRGEIKIRHLAAIARAHHIFYQYDTDKSGTLEADELERMLQELTNHSMEQVDVDRNVREIMRDTDQASFAKFLLWWMDAILPPSTVKRMRRSHDAMSRASDDILDALRELAQHHLHRDAVDVLSNTLSLGTPREGPGDRTVRHILNNTLSNTLPRGTHGTAPLRVDKRELLSNTLPRSTGGGVGEEKRLRSIAPAREEKRGASREDPVTQQPSNGTLPYSSRPVANRDRARPPPLGRALPPPRRWSRGSSQEGWLAGADLQGDAGTKIYGCTAKMYQHKEPEKSWVRIGSGEFEVHRSAGGPGRLVMRDGGSVVCDIPLADCAHTPVMKPHSMDPKALVWTGKPEQAAEEETFCVICATQAATQELAASVEGAREGAWRSAPGGAPPLRRQGSVGGGGRASFSVADAAAAALLTTPPRSSPLRPPAAPPYGRCRGGAPGALSPYTPVSPQ